MPIWYDFLIQIEKRVSNVFGSLISYQLITIGTTTEAIKENKDVYCVPIERISAF